MTSDDTSGPDDERPDADDVSSDPAEHDDAETPAPDESEAVDPTEETEEGGDPQDEADASTSDEADASQDFGDTEDTETADYSEETEEVAGDEEPDPLPFAMIEDEGDEFEDDPPKPKRRGRRALLWAAGGLIVVLGALYGLGYYFTGERLPANTTIADIDVSGQSPAAAQALLTDRLASMEDADIAVHRDDLEFAISPENAGLEFDAQASVREAGGQRSLDPRDMIRLVVGEDDLDPVIAFDEELMQGQLDIIASDLDEPEVEPLITFADGEPQVRDPEPGFRVDQDALTQVIVDAYLRSEESHEVPMTDVEPAVDAAGVQEALDSYAIPAMSGPVTLQVDDREVDLEPSVYEEALRMEVVEGESELTPVIDPEVLAEPLADATSEIGEPAQDAQIVLENGEPTIIDGQTGSGVQPEELAELLIDVLDETGDARSVSVEVREVEPTFTTEDAEELGVIEQVSSFTTNYPPAAYRDTNQGRAAELINGTLLKPGEEFSMNGVVGERTAANGFVEGIVISGGRFDTGFGGGVSQVATTVYNAAYFAGLEFKEFKAHSVYIDRYPKGREATVAWGSLDLRFENNTPYGILIEAYIVPSAGRSQGQMTVNMYSTEHWEVESQTGSEYNRRSGRTIEDSSSSCTGQSPTTGFDIDVTRIWKQNGETIRTEVVTTRYNAADRIVCVPPPSANDDDDDEDDD